MSLIPSVQLGKLRQLLNADSLMYELFGAVHAADPTNPVEISMEPQEQIHARIRAVCAEIAQPKE